jgi:hypothetical protein
MNENTSANKTSRLVLGLAILIALAGVTTVGISYRHSHRLQARLDRTTKELQQTRSELEQSKSASEQTAIHLAKIEPRHAANIETGPAAEKTALLNQLHAAEAELSAMRQLFAENHPKMQQMIKHVERLQKRQQDAK